MGATQAEAAESVNRSRRTVERWVGDDRWELALEEAKAREEEDIVQETRKAFLECVKAAGERRERADGRFLMEALERIDRRFVQRPEENGRSGVNVNVNQDNRRPTLVVGSVEDLDVPTVAKRREELGLEPTSKYLKQVEGLDQEEADA